MVSAFFGAYVEKVPPAYAVFVTVWPGLLRPHMYSAAKAGDHFRVPRAELSGRLFETDAENVIYQLIGFSDGLYGIGTIDLVRRWHNLWKCQTVENIRCCRQFLVTRITRLLSLLPIPSTSGDVGLFEDIAKCPRRICSRWPEPSFFRLPS